MLRRTKITKCLYTILSAIIVAFAAVMLASCSFSITDGAYAEFTRTRLGMEVGEKYDLKRIIRSNVVYELNMPSSSVISLDGTVVTAIKEGSASVYLKSNETAMTGSLRVIVSNDSNLSLEVSGDLYQTFGEESAVYITPHATGSVADDRINWYLDGSLVSSGNSIDSFSVTPTEVGESEILAKCVSHPDIFSTVTVRTYYDVTASGSAAGEFDQDESSRTPIYLSATASFNAANPDNHFEWLVDGKTLYAGDRTTATYRPTAGVHEITLYVNGKRRSINGSSALTVVCSGGVIPENVEVVFDNMYPHIYVAADVMGKMAVEITSPEGIVSVFDETADAELFDEHGFDAKDVIRLCAVGTPRTYKIRVKSLGDGDAFTESDYSEYYEFKQLPAAAKAYIEKIFLDSDHYLTSDEEYIKAFQYYVISRSKTSRKPKIQFDCYIGYEMTYSAEELWSFAFEIGATSGSYSGIGAKLSPDGNILQSLFYVDTVNTPTREAYSAYNKNKYTKQLRTNLPHINYDESKYRPDDYVFPIDEREHSQSVSYTDELYLAAENGANPVPVRGSRAATVYEKARLILRRIVTDEMTDVQKAHAIYDWIMWQVSYDTPATLIDDNGESYSAYYLEGVFGDGITPIGGVVYNPYAVCDGMSKAYSLMCNIEGVPCVRVSGMAGDGEYSSGGHAWNKVFVAGEWYIVDCTWGDSVGEIELYGRTEQYELALHDWLFVTDSYASDTHYEPYMYSSISSRWGNCDIVYAPRTAKKAYPIYENMTYNGVNIDCFVSDDDDARTRVREIASEFAQSYKNIGTVYIPGTGDGEYTIDYQSFEIMLEDEYALSESELNDLIGVSVRRYLRGADVQLYKSENIVLVIVG